MRAVWIAAAVVFVVGCSSTATPPPSATAAPSATATPVPSSSVSAVAPSAAPSPIAFPLTSPAFVEGGAIPREHTCDGADTSPALAWSALPAGTAALVLVVDDIEANAFTHWIVLDLPPTGDGLPAAIRASDPTPQQGTNDFNKPGWGGPCPPSGTHHYRFTLTAIDHPLGLPGQPRIENIQAALTKVTVLGTGVLIGTYQRG